MKLSNVDYTGNEVAEVPQNKFNLELDMISLPVLTQILTLFIQVNHI